MPEPEQDVKSGVYEEDDPFGPSYEDYPPEEDSGGDESQALNDGESPDTDADLETEAGESQGPKENERVRDLVSKGKEKDAHIQQLMAQNQELVQILTALKNQMPQGGQPAKDNNAPPWEHEGWDDLIMTDPRRAIGEALAYQQNVMGQEMDSRFAKFGNEFGEAMQFLSKNPEFAEAVTNGSLPAEMKRRGMKDLWTTWLTVENERLKAAAGSAEKKGEKRAAVNQRLQRERAPAPEAGGGGRVAAKQDLSGLSDHEWRMAIANKLIDGEHLPRSRRGA